MVLKTTLCRFSGLRIWPGRGMLYIRTDNQQFLFLNKKCKSLYHNRLRPAKLAWTTTYRQAFAALPCPAMRSSRGWGQAHKGVDMQRAGNMKRIQCCTELCSRESSCHKESTRGCVVQIAKHHGQPALLRPSLVHASQPPTAARQ